MMLQQMKYISTLNKQQKISLSKHLGTSLSYLYKYGQGERTPLANRLIKIIEWAEINTPKNVPTLDELIIREKR